MDKHSHAGANSGIEFDKGLAGDGNLTAQPDPVTAISIGQLAREAGVSLRALRFYQSKGLLSPLRNGKDRWFTTEDRARLSLILQGKRLGFTLAEIRDMVGMQIGGCEMALAMSRAKCVQQIRYLERRHKDIERALAELRRIYTAMYACGEPASGR